MPINGTSNITINNSTSGGSNLLSILSQIPIEILLLLVTIVLSTLGVYLSLGTHVFQVKTGLRESLEQLDDILIGKNSKVRVILHGFAYSPVKGAVPYISDNRHCVLEFRIHELNDQNIGGAGQPEKVKYFIQDLSMAEIEKMDNVDGIEQNPYSMRVRFNSIEPAKCREISAIIMRKIVEAN